MSSCHKLLFKVFGCRSLARKSTSTVSISEFFFSIHLRFNDPKEILTVLCLLRSFPALQELENLAQNEYQAVVGEVNYGLDDNQNCQLTKLRIVKITGIFGVKAELDFIRFLLSSSPVLEKMTVKPAAANNFQVKMLLQKLLQFKRVSASAEIFYLDP